jgi:hypothetical protein
MKLAIERTLLSLLLLPLTAIAQTQSTSQTYSVSWFYAPDGSTGIVSIIRENDPLTPGGLITQLFYSFCVEPEDATCQEGNGYVPNSVFQGNVYTKLTAKDILSIRADTTVPGYSNWLCITPNYSTASCDGGTSPATGGSSR